MQEKIKKVYRKNHLMLLQRLLIKSLLVSGKTMVNLADSIQFAFEKLALTKEERDVLKINNNLRNIHSGKRCFIIGSGSSLNTQDISPLRNEITFGMNSFWRHSVLDEWQPTYYCFADPIFFDGSEIMLNFHQSLTDKIDNSIFLLPISSKKAIKEQGILSNYNKYYIAFGGNLSNGKAKKFDLVSIIPAVQSVSQFSIMIAMYMGCSPIYLLGLDHDWLSHQGLDRHFYIGKTGFENHPEVHTDLGKYKYVYEVESILKLWKGYETIEKIAKKNKIEILNATNGGFLDVFRRTNYEDIFK